MDDSHYIKPGDQHDPGPKICGCTPPSPNCSCCLRLSHAVAADIARELAEALRSLPILDREAEDVLDRYDTVMGNNHA